MLTTGRIIEGSLIRILMNLVNAQIGNLKALS